MSLILDALNKAERERDISEGIPDLTTLHQPLRMSSNRDAWLVGLAGAVVALLIVAGVLMFVWLNGRNPTPVTEPNSLSTKSGAATGPAAAAGESIARTPITSTERSSSETLTKSSLLASEIEANPDVQALYEVQYGEVALTEPKVVVSEVSADSVTKPADGSAQKSSQGSATPWQSLVDDVSLDAAANSAVTDQQTTLPSTTDSDQDNESYDATSDRAARGSNASAKNSTVDENLARELWEQSRIQPVPENLLHPEKVIKASAPKPEKVEVDLAAGKKFEDTLAAYSNVPFLHELPEATQNRIPSVMYALHNFDKKAVTLNKKSLTDGSSLGGDLVVERVLADGVLLKFKGQQFKLAALSSWVNN